MSTATPDRPCNYSDDEQREIVGGVISKELDYRRENGISSEGQPV